MKPKVNVLLATYNGETFLKRQLDSILEQTYDNIDIYVRDDGSSDKTVEIIRDYENNGQKGKNIIFLESDGVNLGCPASFYEIAKRCEPADYYAFCDQDDEWYPNKIEWAVGCMENYRDEFLVYYSASDYINEDGSFIRKSPRQKQSLKLDDVLYYTPGSGFTIVFNEIARRKMILECNPGTELHDRWMLRGAACFGRAVYDERSTAAHIRHAGAVTANDSGNGSLFKHFIKDELLDGSARLEKKNLRYFCKTFWDDFNETERRTMKLFCLKRLTPSVWAKKVFYPHRLRQRLGGEIALRILFIFGII